MFRVCVCLAVLLSGCAYSQQPSPRRTIIVKERRTCTTIAPQVVADLCMVRKYCTKNPEMTCAEVYYRLTHCPRFGPDDDHAWLDGGVAGKRNGIPCEDRCGKTPLEMKQSISRAALLPADDNPPHLQLKARMQRGVRARSIVTRVHRLGAPS
jgi:hypothetical protein